MTPYEDLLYSMAQADERIVVMTAENRAAIRALPHHLGNRFIDVGICEQTLLGAAAGLALRGRRPVVHALAAFLTMRGFEFIRTDIGIANLPVILVGAVPGLLSDGNGPTHQAIEDVALMRAIPQMKVIAPADENELLQAIPEALKSEGPCYIRYYDGPCKHAHLDRYNFGVAEVHGSRRADVVIATYGMLVAEALEARVLLEAAGITVTVLNMRTVVPLDEQAILQAAAQSKLLVLLEDHFEVGGLYSAVCERLVGEQVRANILPLNLKNRWFRPGLLKDVLSESGFSAQRVASTILQHLEKQHGELSIRTTAVSKHSAVTDTLG